MIRVPEACVSVIGGWQSEDASGHRFGPVFNAVTDLWEWQRAIARVHEVAKRAIKGRAS